MSRLANEEVRQFVKLVGDCASASMALLYSLRRYRLRPTAYRLGDLPPDASSPRLMLPLVTLLCPRLPHPHTQASAALDHHCKALEVSWHDASAYMHEHAGQFDALCLDPCGSVAELLPAAVRCLKIGGLLCASATDLGAMSGRFGEQCAARYGAQPLRSGAKLAPELALRMLLASVARAAGAVGRRGVASYTA